MKKWIICLAVLFALTSLAGCGFRKQIKEKAANEIAEKMIEANGGGDVEIDDDKVIVKGDDGEELVVGGTDWPTSDLAASIPECKDGEITAVLDSADSVMVILESVDEDAAAAYLEAVKEDFTQEPCEASSDGYFSYGAQNADGVGVTVSYSEGTLTITAAKDA